MQRRNSLAVVAALLGLSVGGLSAVSQFLPIFLNRSPSQLGGSVAGISLVLFLLSTVTVFAIGYWTGLNMDVSTEYKKIALVIGLVGGIASFVGFIAGATLIIEQQQNNVFLVGLYNSIIRAVDFSITGLAGAAFAHFRTL